MFKATHLLLFNKISLLLFERIKRYSVSFFFVIITLLAISSCDTKNQPPKTWVKTIDGKYLLWAEKDSTKYSWVGNSFEKHINGKGTLRKYKGNVLVETIVYSDGELPFLGAIYSDDIVNFKNDENEDIDKYIGEINGGKLNGIGIFKKQNGDIYCGEFKNGKPEGQLNLYSGNKILYKGLWKNGVFNGLGTHYLKSGEIKYGHWVNGKLTSTKDAKAILTDGVYTGTMENGIANGLGKMIYSDGSTFYGEWNGGVINGNACWTGIEKDTITGEFTNGLMHGYAESTSTDGEYYGTWKNGKRSGIGSFFYADGSVYNGNWKNHKKEGVGEIFISNGDSYDGYWSNNKRNNFGHYYYYENGDTYSGEWKDNYQNGYGTFESAELKYKGEWTDGKVTGSGDIFYKKTGDHYEGDFKDNLKSGIGAYYFKNGNKYEGEFKNDLFSGNGAFTFKDGNVYQGEFYNAKMYGYGTLYLKESKGIIAITANWDGANNFPNEASILFPNGDLYEGPITNGFPTTKGQWTTEKERLNPKPLALKDKSLADRANSFYKSHRESINYVKEQTQNVLIVVAVASAVITIAPVVVTGTVAAAIIGGTLTVVGGIGTAATVAYSTAAAAEVASKSKDAYDAHKSGNAAAAKIIIADALKDVAFDAAILVGGSAIKAGGKIVKKLPLKAMSKPLLDKGKLFAKRFELSLSQNGTLQKIVVPVKKIVGYPKFVYNRVYKGGFNRQTISKEKASQLSKDKKNSNEQILGKAKSGSILDVNMEKNGSPKLKGTQTHHIVGVDSKCESTKALMAILVKFGVDINDAINGIRLPGGKTTYARGQFHVGSHNCDYYNEVYAILKTAKNKEQFLESMQKVKIKIYNGEIRLNKNKNVNTVYGTKKLKDENIPNKKGQ